MVAEYFGYEIPIVASLGVIVGILSAGIGLSVVLPPEALPVDEAE